jgi:hypothetical protein
MSVESADLMLLNLGMSQRLSESILFVSFGGSTRGSREDYQGGYDPKLWLVLGIRALEEDKKADP